MNQLSLAIAAGAAAFAVAPAYAQEAAPSERFVEFEEVRGEMEFTGVMCARPLQPEDADRLGLTGVELDARANAARDALDSYQLQKYVEGTDEYLFFVPSGATENSVANELLATGGFQYVEPDWLVFPIACPDDPQFNQQWHHQANRMQSCDAWDIETGDPSIVVAICDTGIRATHQDLLLHRYEGYHAPSGQWENQGGPIDDINGHGTLCSGTAAANGDNGVGLSGVGWNLGHRTMRVTDSTGGGASLSNLTNAARTASDVGDKVASVSYSGVTSASVNTAGGYIRNRGALLVWAAGNSSNVLNGSRDDNVIVVGATASSDSLAGFSNRGSFVDLSAPGAGIRTTSRNSNSSYSSVSGTSFACPMAAGLCGLIWSRNPNLTPQEVEDILRNSCDDLGPAGIDNTFGYGRINSNTAMLLTPLPFVTVSYPNGTPDELTPAGGETVDVVVTPGTDAPDTSAAIMWVDTGSGFVAQSASFVGNDTFRGTFPSASCPSNVRYYFEFPLVGGASVTSPLGGSAFAFEALAVERTIFESDDLEAPGTLWVAGVAGDTATTGVWELVDPIGTGAQPEDDRSPNGSFCFVTGQGTANGGLGENDVDDGITTLATPIYDMSLYGDPYMSYWRWYSNSQGTEVDDVFRVDISDDGGITWTSVETLGPNAVSGGWVRSQLRVRDFVTPTTQVRLRFIAEDSGGGSIVEAAIDDLQIFDECPGECGITNYCIAEPNSTGGAAFLGASGSTSVAANDLVIFAANCPPNSVGLFANSPDRASTPIANGTLCLGAQTLGTIIRLGTAPVDGLGNVVYSFDNTAPPLPIAQVTPGSTWNFQFFFRDLAAGGGNANLTDGLSVTFCP
ncbi:MAG: S8 family serine peptidase [Planctomycetota bacterium]